MDTNIEKLFRTYCKLKEGKTSEAEEQLFMKAIQQEENHLPLLDLCQKESPQSLNDDLKIITDNYIFDACPDIIIESVQQDFQKAKKIFKPFDDKRAILYKLAAINDTLQNEYEEESRYFQIHLKPFHYYEEPIYTAYIPFLHIQKNYCENLLDNSQSEYGEKVKLSRDVTALLFFFLRKNNIIKYMSGPALSAQIESLTGFKAKQVIDMLSEKGVESFLLRSNKSVVRKNVIQLIEELKLIVKILENDLSGLE